MKAWILQNAIAIISVLFGIGSLLVSVSNRSDNSTNKARIEEVLFLVKTDTLTDTERSQLVSKIESQSFKEDFYINQIGVQSDWIIFYVSILFAFFGIIGLTVFSNQINQIREDNNNFKKENISQHDKLLVKFNTLKIELEVTQQERQKENEDYIKNFGARFKELEAELTHLAATTYAMHGDSAIKAKDDLLAFDSFLGSADSHLHTLTIDGKNEKIYLLASTLIKDALQSLKRLISDSKIKEFADFYGDGGAPDLKITMKSIFDKIEPEDSSDIITIMHLFNEVEKKAELLPSYSKAYLKQS